MRHLEKDGFFCLSVVSKGWNLLKNVRRHTTSSALAFLLAAFAFAAALLLPYPPVAQATGGSISVSSSSNAYTVVFQAFRIADAYGNPLLPAATEDELSARPEFLGLHGTALMSAVLQKTSEDAAFAAEFASILEAADSSLPRAVVKSDIDPVLVEDGWYALSGTRVYADGRTQPSPLIVLEVRGEPVSMEEKPLDELDPIEPAEPDKPANENANQNANQNSDPDVKDDNYGVGDDLANQNAAQNANGRASDSAVADFLSKLGDDAVWIFLAIVSGVIGAFAFSGIRRKSRR